MSAPPDRPIDTFTTTLGSQELRRRAASGGAFTVAAQGMRFALTIFTMAALARLLSPETFGLFAMTATLTALLLWLGEAGLSQATVQRPEITHQQISTLFWINLAIGGSLAVACWLLAPALAAFYGEPQLTAVTRVMAVDFLLVGAAAQFTALHNRHLRFRLLALLGVGSIVFGAATAVVAAWQGAGVWALVVQKLVADVALLLGLVLAARWLPGLPRRTEGLGGLLGFGGRLALYQLLTALVGQADRILLGAYVGKQDLGLFDRSSNLTRMPLNLIVQPAARVMTPSLARTQDDPAAYRSIFLGALTSLALVVLPGYALLAALAPELVRILLGEQWVAAIPLFSILSVAFMVGTIRWSFNWLWISQGRSGEQLHYGAISAVAFLAAFVCGLPWGTVGVATAGVVAHVLLTPIGVWRVGRSGPVGARALLEALVPGVVLATAVGVVPTVARWQLHLPDHPVPALLELGAIAGVVLALGYAILPDGRRLLRQVLNQLTRGSRSFASAVSRT